MGAMAGFGAPSDWSEPVGAMAGFGSGSGRRRCRATVSRLTPSWSAMRRWDQPRRCSVRIVSLRAILSRFAMVRLLGQRGCPEAYRAHLSLLKMAGFQAPVGGWI